MAASWLIYSHRNSTEATERKRERKREREREERSEQPQEERKRKMEGAARDLSRRSNSSNRSTGPSVARQASATAVAPRDLGFIYVGF